MLQFQPLGKTLLGQMAVDPLIVPSIFGERPPSLRSSLPLTSPGLPCLVHLLLVRSSRAQGEPLSLCTSLVQITVCYTAREHARYAGHVGILPLLDWTRHFASLGIYSALNRLAGPRLSSESVEKGGRKAFLARRRAEAYEFGSGSDYKH